MAPGGLARQDFQDSAAFRRRVETVSPVSRSLKIYLMAKCIDQTDLARQMACATAAKSHGPAPGLASLNGLTRLQASPAANRRALKIGRQHLSLKTGLR